MGRDVLSYNHQMHVKLIGGEDSDDPACLYKAYEAASSVLGMFDDRLTEEHFLLGFGSATWLPEGVSFPGCFCCSESSGPSTVFYTGPRNRKKEIHWAPCK